MFNLLRNFFKPKEKDLIEEIYSGNLKNKKIITQRLDENITLAEIKYEAVSQELDSLILEKNLLLEKLQEFDEEKNQWQIRSHSLKLERLNSHIDNLKRRAEIFSQNIKVYLNILNRIEDIEAMQLQGIDSEKIQEVWLEFQEACENYKSLVVLDEACEASFNPVAKETEKKIATIKKEIFPEQEPEKKKETSKKRIDLSSYIEREDEHEEAIIE